MDDNEWEDVQSTDRTNSRPSSPNSTTSTTLSSTPRKRTRAIYVSGSPRKRFTMGAALQRTPVGVTGSTTSRESVRKTGLVELTKNTPVANLVPVKPLQNGWQPTDQKRSNFLPMLQDTASSGAVAGMAYVTDVLSFSIIMLKKPIGLVLTLWLLSFLAAQSLSSVRQTLRPLCIIPGISQLHICLEVPSSTDKGTPVPPRRADYPALMTIQSNTLEKLLDEAAGGSGFVYEIKRAEIATGDLLTLVKLSELTARDRLADTLTDFIEKARLTGQGLQRLNTQVNGAVDSIVAVNDYALKLIEASESASPFALAAILPFGLSPHKPDLVLRETFADAMGSLSTNMARLIVEAQVSLTRLDELEQQLSLIYELIARENIAFNGQKDELLGQLWTMLGGNRRQLRHFNNHLALLNDLGMYRKRALAHVVAALQTLQAMNYEMEDLRARVAAPELVGERIPIGVHIQSIKSGLDRLNEGRLKARERGEAAIQHVLGNGPALIGR